MQKRFDYHYRNYFFQNERQFFPFASQEKSLQEKIQNKNILGLLESYTMGKQKNLSKSIKEMHNSLGLLHLFTPSGIHLSAILFFFFPIGIILKRRSEKVYLLLSSILYLIPYFFLPGYYSIRRIFLLRFFSIFAKKFSSSLQQKKEALLSFISILQDELRKGKDKEKEKEKDENAGKEEDKNTKLKTSQEKFKSILKLSSSEEYRWFIIFILTFLFDFFFGTYQSSVLSFSYSFLFLGIIFSTPHYPKILLPLRLLSGQILISFFMSNQVSLIGIFLGFFLTAFFSLIFPILFFSMLFSPLINPFFAKHITQLFFILLEKFYLLQNLCPKIFISIPIILLVFLTNFKIKTSYKQILMAFLLILHSSPIINAPLNGTLIESLYKQVRPLYNEALRSESKMRIKN